MASDIATDSQYLPPDAYSTQTNIDQIANWTDMNLMKLNEAKCKYMIFSRSKENFTTRLKINGENLERISAIQLLGVWITEDLSWDKNLQTVH